MKTVCEVITIIVISIVTYSILFYFTSCTLSFNMAQSEGKSADMIDEDQKPANNLQLTIPAI